jgi:CO/xanthine dehydrogenase Mo-binding subunit
MMHGTIHRPATVMQVQLGAEKDGRLNAFSMMTWTHCHREGNFTEHASNFGRALYAAPNRLTGHRLVKLDLPGAGPMRAPGEASGDCYGTPPTQPPPSRSTRQQLSQSQGQLFARSCSTSSR